MAAEGVACTMFYKFQGVKVHVFITCSHTHHPSHMRWQEVPCGNVSQKQSLERCSFAHKMSLPQKTRRFSGPAVHVSVVVVLRRALVVQVEVSRRPRPLPSCSRSQSLERSHSLSTAAVSSRCSYRSPTTVSTRSGPVEILILVFL